MVSRHFCSDMQGSDGTCRQQRIPSSAKITVDIGLLSKKFQNVLLQDGFE
jgi:hypothetical protein